MDFPFGETVTIVSGPAAEDAYGDTDTSEESETTWGPCAIAPRTSSERTDNRAPAVVTGLTVYGPSPGPAVNDLVRIDSGPYVGTWSVEGIPGDWRSPFTGWNPGVEVALERASSRVEA